MLQISRISPIKLHKKQRFFQKWVDCAWFILDTHHINDDYVGRKSRSSVEKTGSCVVVLIHNNFVYFCLRSQKSDTNRPELWTKKHLFIHQKTSYFFQYILYNTDYQFFKLK